MNRLNFNKEKKKTAVSSQQHSILRRAAPSRCCLSGCQPIRAAFGYANTWSRTKRLEPNVTLSAHLSLSQVRAAAAATSSTLVMPENGAKTYSWNGTEAQQAQSHINPIEFPVVIDKPESPN